MPGLVVSSDSGFAVIRMAGKCRIVMANAVRSSCFFCHYERSEVIQKQVLLANRLLPSLRFFASDKSRASDKPRAKTKIPCKTKALVKEGEAWRGTCGLHHSELEYSPKKNIGESEKVKILAKQYH